MAKKILITSALPYANGPLHFGHIAGAYLPGDCYARFERLMGNDVLYVCGSDEYGVAITLSAEIAGRSPQEHVAIFHEMNKNLFRSLNFTFDHYSRTTWKGHKQPVQEFFLDLLNNGYIEERVTNQLYSEVDKKFLADRYVVGECPKCGFLNARGDECPSCAASYDATDLINPRSKITNSALELRPTRHWFLLLDKFKEQLLNWLSEKNWKPNVLNFIKGYIQDLHPRAITRDSNWGIPIPLANTEGKVLYVWFDAPIGYISATMEWALQQNDPTLWKNYWEDPETKLVNFIGKDNIPFHAAIFPAMIMGQNRPYKLVDELPANEFYKLEGRQFSKSDGWYIDLDDFFKRYSSDQIRYVIAANAPETSDSDFTWKDFQNRCNAELVGKFGNFVNRVLVFIHQKFNGIIPERSQEDLQSADFEFLDKIKELTEQAKSNYQTFKLRAAAQTIMELAQVGNIYFDKKKPWQDAKQESLKQAMQLTLHCCLECIKALSLISNPIIPEASQKIWEMLGYSDLLSNQQWDVILNTPLEEGKILKTPTILFQKIEDTQIQEEIATLHQMIQNQTEVINEENKKEEVNEIIYAPLKPLINYEDFSKIDLRVALIIAAEPVPKSKKLLKLEVDLGFEKRTVVSGISQYYKPEELVGKKIALVANLAPSKLMGITSQGMVLAAHTDTALELPQLQLLSPGSQIT